MPHHLSEPDDNVAVDEGGTPVKAPKAAYYAGTLDSFHSALNTKPQWDVKKVQIYDVNGAVMTIYPKHISLDTQHSFDVNWGPKLRFKLDIAVDSVETSLP